MASLSLPPRGVFITSAFLGLNLPPSIERTVIRIFATTVMRPDHRSPCLRWQEWWEFVGLQRRQFIEQIRIASSAEYRVLKYYVPKDGTIQFEFPCWCYSDFAVEQKPGDLCEKLHSPDHYRKDTSNYSGDKCNNLHSPVKEEEEYINLTPPPPATVQKVAQRKEIPDGLRKVLEELGVFTELFGEVEEALADGYKAADILALAIWQHDAPQRFITRLRKGTRAPSKYYDFSERRIAGKWVPEGA